MSKTNKNLKSKFRLSMVTKRALLGYFFLTPFLIGIIFFFCVPLYDAVKFSRSVLSVGSDGYVLQDVGWSNYYKLFFVDPYFRTDLLGEIGKMVPQVILIVIFSLFTATLINQRFRGRALARAIMFLPIILTSGVILSIEKNDEMLTMLSDMGTQAASMDGETMALMQSLSSILNSLNINSKIVIYIVKAVEGVYDIIIASGVQILIFLAGLQSIPSSLYEASTTEGATGWENFWKITFPMISPLIFVNLIYSIIDSFTKPTNQMMISIYNQAFANSNYGVSSAMAIVYFLVILVILGITTGLVSRKVFYYD